MTFEKKIHEFLEQNPRATILDVGCNSCEWFFSYLKFNPKKLVGIDKLPATWDMRFGWYLYELYNIVDEGPNLILRHKEKAKEFDNVCEFEFGLDGKIENYKVKFEEYNLITALNVLHFVHPDELSNCIQKVFQGLKEDGQLFIALQSYEKYLLDKKEGRMKNYKVDEKTFDENFDMVTITDLAKKKKMVKYYITKFGIEKFYKNKYACEIAKVNDTFWIRIKK